MKIIITLILCGFINSLFSQKIISDKNCPVTIFYGYNESHGNEWIQYADNGTTGICFFLSDNSNSAGTLIYKSIQPNGDWEEEIICSGVHLEISVLLFDSLAKPHIFLAQSDNNNQIILEFTKNNEQWLADTIVEFNNEGGKFIYELSAKKGIHHTFHLLLLKTRSNPDSDDYYGAFQDACLYYLTNSTGAWRRELIHQYDMIYTLDEYCKSMNRRDLDIDSNNKAHIVFGEQINGQSGFSPSRLCYATNKNGSWQLETAVNYNSNTRDDAGWYPSLCLDKNDVPCIACTYFGRVSSGSAMYAKLQYVRQNNEGIWEMEIVAATDDGYYGTDGHNYTGGLAHLKFDLNNNPLIVFTDIASSHNPMNELNLGNIRIAKKIENFWQTETIYRQALPLSFFNATEMYGLCFLINENTGRMEVIGQELEVRNSNNYNFNFINLIITEGNQNKQTFQEVVKFQCSPNPFIDNVLLQLQLNKIANINCCVYAIYGNKVHEIFNGILTEGKQSINLSFQNMNSGVYFVKLKIDNKNYIKKIIKI